MFQKDKKKTATAVLLAGILLCNSLLLTACKKEEPQPEPEPEPVIEIFNGDKRPVAVMLDNNINAVPQAGLNEAYIVYEIIVEGGETRLMALFKNKDELKKIGPLRSSRHYFLDYALENDAIYVHYGWSPQAQKDISSLKVNNIHGISEGSKNFWRVSDRSSPHNVVTDMPKLLAIAAKKGYSVTSDKKSVLHYTDQAVDLEALAAQQPAENQGEGENGEKVENKVKAVAANKITIPYSYSNTVEYTYDKESQRYTRYTRGVKQTDWATDKAVTTKNIIVTFAKNYDLNDGSGKGRQGLKNIGTMKGYYITNGKSIPITCEKTARDAQTVYRDANGNEINVSDGNTWIQICPSDAKVKIKE